jgi:hypothetical protein
MRVGHDLEMKGINMLRQSTSTVPILVLPEKVQIGYTVYKGNLPVFMSAYMDDEDKNMMQIYHPIRSIPFSDCIMLGLPAMTVGWASARDEMLAAYREENDGQDVVVQGKGAMVFHKVTPDLVNKLRASNCLEQCPAVYNAANISCIPYVMVSLRIATIFMSMQQYPAFRDKEHYENLELMEGLDLEPPADNMSEDDEHVSGLAADRAKKLRIREEKKKGFPMQYKTALKGLKPFSVQETYLGEIQQGMDGLWFPYVPELANPDTDTVPNVIRKYFFGCLGADEDNAIACFEGLKGAWGLLGKTVWGKALAHIYKLMEVALEAQGMIRLVYDQDIYLGAVVMGAGWKITVNRKRFEPGSSENLKDAIIASGSNVIVLRKIGAKLNLTEAAQANFEKMTSLWAIRSKMMGLRIKPEDHGEIINLAKSLRFMTPYWQPGRPGLEKAARLMSETTALNDYNADEDFPIHPTALFSDDRDFVFWSCFGPIVPSFLIPGSPSFDLTKEDNIVSKKSVERGQKGIVKAPVTSISARMVPLELGVEDLKRMKATKAVLNPFNQPKVKRSTVNQYKTWSGSEMGLVVSALRTISGASVTRTSTMSLKRPGGEPDDNRGGKKSVISYDM